MVQHQLFEVEEISPDDPPFPHIVPDLGPSHPRDIRTIDEIKAALGVVYVPSRVPEGFAFKEAQLIGGHAVELSYRRKGMILSILQDSHFSRPRIASGHSSVVSVNGRPAQLIRGAWLTIVDNDGVAKTRRWDPDMALSLMSQLHDRWVLVEVVPAPRGFGEAELIRIAESLAPYQAHP